MNCKIKNTQKQNQLDVCKEVFPTKILVTDTVWPQQYKPYSEIMPSLCVAANRWFRLQVNLHKISAQIFNISNSLRIISPASFSFPFNKFIKLNEAQSWELTAWGGVAGLLKHCLWLAGSCSRSLATCLVLMLLQSYGTQRPTFW